MRQRIWGMEIGLASMTCAVFFLGAINRSHAGVVLNLELTSLGTVLTTNYALFQHTDTKHPKLDAFLTTQDDYSGTSRGGGATGGGNGKGNGGGNGGGGSASGTGDGIIAAFNGASASAGNPEAIFNGGTPDKTHTILLGDIPTTSDGLYRVFLFDANQNQSEADDHVDITMIRLFTSSSNSLTDISQLASQTLIYDLSLDDGIDYVRVDGSIGTGGADMYFYLPNTMFVSKGATDTTNVYLYYEYSNFNDGPEAWSLDKSSTYSNPTVPEPAAMVLWACGGLGGLFWRRRRSR